MKQKRFRAGKDDTPAAAAKASVAVDAAVARRPVKPAAKSTPVAAGGGAPCAAGGLFGGLFGGTQDADGAQKPEAKKPAKPEKTRQQINRELGFTTGNALKVF